MQFVKSDDLKVGMRLARPIYNRNGVLLYERNSKLTGQGILSIRTFGLIGIFILEPAEPVPPMTADDLEFERFQMMQVFSIEEEMKRLWDTRKAGKVETIVSNIIRSYGNLDHKINFIQGLRSREDYLYKHSLNVAILCAMICHAMKLGKNVQHSAVRAAVLHDIGQLRLPRDMIGKNDLDAEEKRVLDNMQAEGFRILDQAYMGDASVKRICGQCYRCIRDFQDGQKPDIHISEEAKVMAVAQTYDQMTAMQFGQNPSSEVTAVRHLLEHPDVYDARAVRGLLDSIHILAPGTSVELNTRDKALVISVNPGNILRPVLLNFRDNSVIDLELRGNRDIEITDIMKTMDNRHVMDTAALKRQGFMVEEPKYVDVSGN